MQRHAKATEIGRVQPDAPALAGLSNDKDLRRMQLLCFDIVSASGAEDEAAARDLVTEVITMSNDNPSSATVLARRLYDIIFDAASESAQNELSLIADAYPFLTSDDQ